MPDAGWMNLASLCLSLAAWGLPLTALAFRKKAGGRLCLVLVWAGMAACAAALYFQICCQSYLVQIHDVSTILDTTDALVLVAGALLAVTLALDALVPPHGAQEEEKAAQALDAAEFYGYNAVAS